LLTAVTAPSISCWMTSMRWEALERARRLFEHNTLGRARRNRSCRGAISPGTSPSSEPEKNKTPRPVLPLLPTDPGRGL
jgi:hypothetical protein